MKLKILLGFIFMCFLAQSDAFSQITEELPAKRDSSKTTVKKETIVKDSARLAIEAMPRRAAMKSLMLPGLGQIYNKRWWKVPLVYGGFLGIGLVFEFNQRNYKVFLKEAQFRELNPGKTQNPLYSGYTNEGIIAIKDAYRRDRDLSVLAGLGFYAITIIDAYVDAKFFRFDISDELSLQVKPSVSQTMPVHTSAFSPAVGLKLKLSL
ncbi:MAG: DUF5683 domain-containing protein [Pedobacter sp.]|jgi:hypothetical protein